MRFMGSSNDPPDRPSSRTRLPDASMQQQGAALPFQKSQPSSRPSRPLPPPQKAPPRPVQPTRTSQEETDPAMSISLGEGYTRTPALEPLDADAEPPPVTIRAAPVMPDPPPTPPAPVHQVPASLMTTLASGGFGAAQRGVLPPELAVRHDAEAALGGVAGASWAASVRERAGNTAAPADAPQPAVPPVAPAPRSRTVLVDVLWHAADAAKRARGHADWATVAPAASSPGAWIKSGSAEQRPTAERDARDVSRALTHLRPLDAAGVMRSMRDAVDDDGVFVRPLLVVGGELTLAFDPNDFLTAMVAAARPFVASDKRLEAAVTAADDATQPGVRSLPATLEALRVRLAQAFAQGTKNMPRDYLESAAERSLLEEHRYATRLLFGSRHFCAHLTPPNGSPIPTYLPEAAAAMLPLLRRFDARLLVEPHPRQDPTEAADIAIAALALARVMPLGRETLA
jgi:hypothetical protein